MKKLDETMAQTCNDMKGILEQSGLPFWEQIAALDFLKYTMLEHIEYGTRKAHHGTENQE